MGGGGMGGMQDMIRQAQKMQEDMARMQEKLHEREFEASSGGGVVTCKVSGGKKVLNISIQPEVVDPDDVEMLEDLIIAAINEALQTADETVSAEMSKLTGGMDLGGLL
jgi:DNA-binding YbaB/EbfC family protein